MLTKHILNLDLFHKQLLADQLLLIGTPFIGRGSNYHSKMYKPEIMKTVGVSSRIQRWTLEFTYTTLKKLIKKQEVVDFYYNLDLLGLTLGEDGLIPNTDVPKELAEMRIQINQIKRLSMDEMIAATLTTGKTQKLLNFKDQTIIKRVKGFWSEDTENETSAVSMKIAKYLTIDVLELLKRSIENGYPVLQINGILSELCIAIAIDVKTKKIILTRI